MTMTTIMPCTTIDHDHGHRHDARVKTYSLVARPAGAVFGDRDVPRPAALGAWREACCGMKGIIELAEDPSRPLVVHGVQTILHPPARLPAWPDGSAARGWC